MHLSSEWTEYATAIGLPDIQFPTSREEAAVIRAYVTQFEESVISRADTTGLDVISSDVPTRDGQKVRVLIYKPEGPGTFPVLLYMHGGGWVLGRPETDDPSVRRLCQREKVVIVSLDYRLAPENPWPTQVNDCEDALKWVSIILPLITPETDEVSLRTYENASYWQGDVSKGIIVSGFSAGGHLAAVLAVRAIRGKLDMPLRGVVLRSPMLSDWRALSISQSSALKSIQENADAPVINSNALRRMFELYNASSEIRTDPEEFPLHLNPKEAKGFPRTFIQVSQADPLRDEGLLFRQTLDTAGVDVQLIYYEGMPHGFHMHEIETGKKAERDLAEGVNWLLRE